MFSSGSVFIWKVFFSSFLICLWNHIFGDQILTESVVDRFIHHSHPLMVIHCLKN
ncbi:ATP-binding protein [Carnobacterium alterfunditum]|uniref:ATP-binding protein n=1 Tax=Carnobacterium alterfunditum TaxID=28230 RepID=UPI001FE8D5C3|nr:ATP-binding protein [Carnobacterium alterfunditum]